MKQIMLKLIALPSIYCLMLGLSTNAQSAQTQSLVEGNTAFALDLYSQLKNEPGNLFFSPYSISSCLAMAYAGARAETEKQMGNVLHFEPGQVHSSFGELQSNLKQAAKESGVELNI